MMVYIAAHSLVTRAKYETVGRATWADRFRSLGDLVPTAVLIFLVLGTLYLGLITATEAGALGVVGAMGVAALYRRLKVSLLHAAVRATARTTSMVGLIIIAALTVNYVLGSIRLPAALASALTSLPLSPFVLMGLILFFYLALGTFMDGFTMMVTTLPVMFPVVMGLGYDPVWFGVVMTMVIEMALISPPDGMVMYVLQGLRKPTGPISDVFYGVMPFLGVYILSFLIIFLVPEIILWPVR
jgi:tripartite ATP-independent transporter DctM subunit